MSHKGDSLGDRMKSYENVSRIYLMRRTPAIIRIDGKAFHTFTRGFEKPFDTMFAKTMQQTMQYLCENIQGCVLGYTQSDEITLVLTDYNTIRTEAWFGYNIQKVASVSASMATMAFNEKFEENVLNWANEELYSSKFTPEIEKLYFTRESRFHKAMFDSRVFSLPKDEVCNCLIWRQQDATRNSIEMLGRAHFSHKELHQKSCNKIQDMLMLEKGINWNDIPTMFKRGSCCIKQYKQMSTNGIEDFFRLKWVIDTEIPIFTQNRNYIESRLEDDKD